MKNNFVACWRITKVYEGGFTANKADPGNWTGGKVGKGELKGTNMGVSAAAFPNLDIKNLTEAQAMTIYQKQYWDAVRADDLPAGVDLGAWDYGVNSGPGRSIRDLQAVAGVVVDGKIGPATIAAVAQLDGVGVIQKLCARRLGYMQGLKVWNAFKKGWSARVANVEAKGVAMFLAATMHPALAKITLLDAAAAAQDKAKSQTKTAANVGAGAAVSAPAAVTLDHAWAWALAACALLGVVAAIVIARHHNAARAQAYQEAAANV
jgi:lysozyme family protein